MQCQHRSVAGTALTEPVPPNQDCFKAVVGSLSVVHPQSGILGSAMPRLRYASVLG